RSASLQFRGRLPARFGLPSSRLSEEQFLQRVHPDDLPRIRASMESMRRGNALRYENEFRFADALGDYHWLLSRGRVLERDPENGYTLLLAGTYVDRSEERRVGQEW